MARDFEIIGEITNVETIAVGSSIRVIKRLKRFYAMVVGASSKVFQE